MNTRKDFPSNQTILFYSVLSALLGLACVVVPAYVIPGQVTKVYPAPFFSVIWTAVDSIAFRPTLIGLLLLGFVLGLLQPKIWWLSGLASMAIFPIALLIELLWSGFFPSATIPERNLWPFEIVIYMFATIPTLVGALSGCSCRKFILRKTQQGNQSDL